MEQAIERLRTVPETEQDRLAQFLLNELEEDERWAQSTATHADKLGGLVANVLADDEQGKCLQVGPDDL